MKSKFSVIFAVFVFWSCSKGIYVVPTLSMYPNYNIREKILYQGQPSPSEIARFDMLLFKEPRRYNVFRVTFEDFKHKNVIGDMNAVSSEFINPISIDASINKNGKQVIFSNYVLVNNDSNKVCLVVEPVAKMFSLAIASNGGTLTLMSNYEIIGKFNGEYGNRVYLKRIIGVPKDTLFIALNKVTINSIPIKTEFLSNGILTAGNGFQSTLGIFESKYEGNKFLIAHSFRNKFTQIESLSNDWPLCPINNFKGIVGPVDIPIDNYFVMGDNRDDSMDSRLIGFVPKSAIVGLIKNH